MHRSATTATPRRAATSAALALALAWLAWGATPARAQMYMGITTNSSTVGLLTNSLDVTLTNNTDTSYTIANFFFQITAAGSNVTFNSVTDNTASYIFTGNSEHGPNIEVGDTGQSTISGRDSSTSGGITLTAHTTLDLGHVLFTLSPSTQPGTPIPISFAPISNVSNQFFTNLSPELKSGQIVPTSVPELPPTALVVTGLLLGVGDSLRRFGLAKLLTRLGSH